MTLSGGCPQRHRLIRPPNYRREYWAAIDKTASPRACSVRADHTVRRQAKEGRLTARDCAPLQDAPSWWVTLDGMPTVDALRSYVLRHHPAFDPAGLHEVIILGAAVEGQRLAALCGALGIKVAAISDDDPAKIGTSVLDHPVVAMRELAKFDRATPVVIASHRVVGAAERLSRLGFSAVAPFAVLQALDPERFPPHMFYAGLLEDTWKHREHYRWLAAELADDRSREVLDAVLTFRQTFDPRVLAAVVEPELYQLTGLLRYGHDEVYVDGGAFDGDTIRLFSSRVGGRYGRIYAFEPDPKTFAVLKQNFVSEPRVEPINAGLYRCKATLRFRDDASRGAIFAKDGGTEIAVTTIDDVMGKGRVTFIKMNIEGAEIDALNGAERTIRRWRPKLAISAYHRPSDLWRIPRLVRRLSEDYGLYLRQHDGGVIETVLYGLPRS
jgi:FkbM family methyltransferase